MAITNFSNLSNVLLHFCERGNTSQSVRSINELRELELHWESTPEPSTSVSTYPYETINFTPERLTDIRVNIKILLGGVYPQPGQEIIVQTLAPSQGQHSFLYCGIIASITVDIVRSGGLANIAIRLYPLSELFRLVDMLIQRLDEGMQPPDDRIADPLWYRIASDLFRDRGDNDMTERYLNVAYILERAGDNDTRRNSADH